MRELDICSDAVATGWNGRSGSGYSVISPTSGFGVEPQENLSNYTYIPFPNIFKYISNHIFRRVDVPREFLKFIWGHFEAKKIVVTVGVT